MSSVLSVLKNAEQQLLTSSSSPRLDAELLLAHVLNVNRSFFFTHSRESISKKNISHFESLVKRRLQGEPIAYLVGHKEFWTLDLRVTKDTLIPRPETELLVQLILSLLPQETNIKIADLGVGSGAIALSIALEKPEWIIHGTEISSKALKVANENRQRNKLNNVIFFQGNWCEGLTEKKYHLIVSNPPYIAAKDSHLKSLAFEPQSALVSGEDGLDDIRIIIKQSRDYLDKNGLLLLEHGYDQQNSVSELLLEFGFSQIETYVDISGLPRAVAGRWLK